MPPWLVGGQPFGLHLLIVWVTLRSYLLGSFLLIAILGLLLLRESFLGWCCFWLSSWLRRHCGSLNEVIIRTIVLTKSLFRSVLTFGPIEHIQDTWKIIFIVRVNSLNISPEKDGYFLKNYGICQLIPQIILHCGIKFLVGLDGIRDKWTIFGRFHEDLKKNCLKSLLFEVRP